jgi:hypothetical protein
MHYMPRKPSTFRQGDVTRAVKAITKAGLQVVGVKISREGNIEIITSGDKSRIQGGANEWDKL